LGSEIADEMILILSSFVPSSFSDQKVLSRTTST
jgi:hypothetical protein